MCVIFEYDDGGQSVDGSTCYPAATVNSGDIRIELEGEIVSGVVRVLPDSMVEDGSSNVRIGA